MDTRLVKITPAIAREWLKRNSINRPLRPSRVAEFVDAFRRNEYRVTHQGIAFADTGELIDGQHRLTAIAQMPEGFSVEMLVSKGLSKDVFRVIDRGAKRTLADALGIGNGHAAVARFLAAINETTMRGAGLTPDVVLPYVKATAHPYGRLVDYCGSISKTWSCAAVRSAAVLRIMEGADFDHVALSYTALVHHDYDTMVPVIKVLHRQQEHGRPVSSTDDMFYRCWRAFDPANRALTKIQITDTGTVLAAARAVMAREVFGMVVPAARRAAGPAPATVRRRVEASR